MEILVIIVGALITNNIIFSQSLGMCSFLGVSKKMNSAVGMGLAVTFVMTVSAIISWIFFNFVLTPLSLQYLQIIVFILVIGSLVQLLDIVLKKLTPVLYNSLGIYLALIITNCAILGTANAIAAADLNILEVVFTSVFVGLGFLLALVLMSGVREKLETAPIPKHFKGFPIALIIGAIMAMAFIGFRGIDDTMRAFFN